MLDQMNPATDLDTVEPTHRNEQDRLAFNKPLTILYSGLCQRILALQEITEEARNAATKLSAIMGSNPNGDWNEEEVTALHIILAKYGYLNMPSTHMSHEQAAAILQQTMPDEVVNQPPEPPTAETRAAKRRTVTGVFVPGNSKRRPS